MTDPSIEERKHWIRKKWIEKLDFDQKIFNVRLSKPTISTEEAEKVRELLDESSKLKERIEGGFTPKEAPITAYKPKDGKLIPLTQEEQFEDDKIHDEHWEHLDICLDGDDIAIEPPFDNPDNLDILLDDEYLIHPDHEPRKTKAKKIIASIRDFLLRGRKKKTTEQTEALQRGFDFLKAAQLPGNRSLRLGIVNLVSKKYKALKRAEEEKRSEKIVFSFLGVLALCCVVFGLVPTLSFFFSSLIWLWLFCMVAWLGGWILFYSICLLWSLCIYIRNLFKTPPPNG